MESNQTDLRQIGLKQRQRKYVRLDGSMSRTARIKSITSFQNNSADIMLVSLTAGGLG